MGKLEPFTRGVPIGVDVASIDRELSALWKSAADAVEGDTTSAVMRACTANFILYTEDEKASDKYPALIQDITVEQPARVILIISDPSAHNSSLDSWISAHCHVPAPGGKQVCSEQITLLARGDAVWRVPNVVLSLLVPDEPVILWVDGNLLKRKELFEPPLRLTDHLVFDSAHFPSPGDDLRELWRMVRTAREEASVRPSSFGDLNWSRLFDWRKLVAEFFDPPSRRADIFRISSVSISFEEGGEAEPSGLTQAILFLGWFASRLEWTVASRLLRQNDRSLTARFESIGSSIDAHLVPAASIDDVANDVLSVEVEVEGGKTSRYSAIRRDNRHCVETTVEVAGCRPIRRVAEMRKRSEALTVGEQVGMFGRDRSYEEALDLAAAIAGSGE